VEKKKRKIKKKKEKKKKKKRREEKPERVCETGREEGRNVKGKEKINK
jgi:hypothetical protein